MKNEEFHFELYKIGKGNNGIFTSKCNLTFDQTSIEKIKEHIVGFFNSKNSYSKHLTVDDLPNGWLKCFSDPIKEVFNVKGKNIKFEYLIDGFIKQGLSPQSHNMARRDKYVLLMYKRGDFFILAHLTVKKGIILEKNNNIELSNLLFSTDTLLRYIHISLNSPKKYDIVVREQTLTQTFIKFLDIGEEFFNKDSYGELSISGNNNGTSMKIDYPPADFFKKYISKEIKVTKENGKLIISDNYGINLTVDKITIGNKPVDINKALEISFIEKLAINTAISESLTPLNQLNLFSDSNVIIEGKNQVRIGNTKIDKLFSNSYNENCIYFSIPIGENGSLQYSMEEKFLAYIYDCLFFSNNKKTIVFSLYENKPGEFLDKSFNDVYNESNIYFSNLSLIENIKINEEITPIKQKIKEGDTEIMKGIYKIDALITLCFFVKGHKHLYSYFKLLLDECIKKFSSLKSYVFSEAENNTLEYKSGKALHFERNWEKNCYERIKCDIETKIDKINPGCILYGFDENEREVGGVDLDDFRKFADDKIDIFQKRLKQDCGLEYVQIYKIPGNIKIILVYIRKQK